MNCPYCEYDLKMETVIDLLREIREAVKHCPTHNLKSVFDRELHREPRQENTTQIPAMALEDQP